MPRQTMPSTTRPTASTTTTKTQTPRTWGLFVADFTSACPRLSVSTLTSPQADVIYLHDFSERVVPFRTIAALYAVAPSTVHRHHRRGWQRLEAAGAVAPLPEPPAAGNRVACVECDTPWMDCTTCIDVYVIGDCDPPMMRVRRDRKPTTRNALRQASREEAAGREFKSTIDLEHFAGHHAPDDDWHDRIDTGHAAEMYRGDVEDW
jgi:hypothetical protein